MTDFFSLSNEEYYGNVLPDGMSIPADPMDFFRQWFAAAQQKDSSHANIMTLATVDESGNPHARIVLLKHFFEGKFVFFTNYNSDKARDLDTNLVAALVFYWPSFFRQVRIEGNVSKITKDLSIQYFESRSIDSQLSAIISPQSKPIPSRKWLVDRWELLKNRVEKGEALSCPDYWGGYQLLANKIEFWQGQPHRLNDRLKYSRVGEGESWDCERLAP